MALDLYEWVNGTKLIPHLSLLVKDHLQEGDCYWLGNME